MIGSEGYETGLRYRRPEVDDRFKVLWGCLGSTGHYFDVPAHPHLSLLKLVPVDLF